MMTEIQIKGDLGVDELEQDFLKEVCQMRMDIAFQRLLQTRTHKEAERMAARDEAIDALYDQVAKECTDEGKKLLFKYTEEMVYREVPMQIFITRPDLPMNCS